MECPNFTHPDEPLGKFSVPWNHRKREVQHTLSSFKRRDRERANSVNMNKVGGEKIVKMKTKEADDELIDNQKKDVFFFWWGG